MAGLTSALSSAPAIMNNPRSEPLFPARTATSEPSAAQRASTRVATRKDVVEAPAASLVEDEALFLSSLSVIDDVTAQVCRRHRLTPAEAEDFNSEVRVHFIQRNYEPLRRFEGRSSLRTYLTVVIHRLLFDYRNRLWGKWRPSSEARRLGPTAQLIERLVLRDGWTFDQVVEMLRVNHGVSMAGELEDFCARLRQRPPGRQIVSENHASEVESATSAPDANVVRAEQGFLAKRLRASLDRARHALSADERLILKMRFEDGMAVADIARALHLNQKRLYRTIDGLLASLGRSLEAEGLSRDVVRTLFAEGNLDADQVADIGEDVAGASPGQAPADRSRRSWLHQR